jgi:hypothetical protein
VFGLALLSASVDWSLTRRSISQRSAKSARTIAGIEKHDFALSPYVTSIYFWRWNNR